jgi:hypothetical protein
MKIRLVCFALILALIPTLSSTQTLAGSRVSMTDAQRDQVTHTFPMIRPDFIGARMLARGFVNSNGTKASGSPNWTVSFDGTYYHIAISGVNYFYSSFTTVVTPAIPKGAACASDSLGGNLLVSCYDSANNVVAAAFGFTTFGN